MSKNLEDNGEPRRRAMTNVDAIKVPADALSLLDVSVSGERDWHGALARHSLFRIPAFKAQYNGLAEALIEASDNEIDSDADFERLFRKEASRVAGKLISNRKLGTQPWSEANYGRGQLDHALHGTAMRFDKAVISVLAFNRFAQQNELLDRYALGEHSVVVCGFFFSNLHRLIESFAGADDVDGETPFMRGAAEIAAMTGQTPDVIEALAGKRAESLQTGAREKAVTHLGSYPTQFGILEALATKLREAKDALDEVKQQAESPTVGFGQRRPVLKIERLIVRRRQGMSPPKTLGDESIEPHGRVTWGPFGWGPDPDEPERMWPTRS
jgi:hypothetical protein